MKNVKIQILNSDGNLPVQATPHSAGYDLFASEAATLEPGDIRMVSTGIAMEMEPGMEAQVRPRSGLAMKHGITVINSPGTIDADYRGEIKVGLVNHSRTSFLVEKGMRIAQMVFSQVIDVKLSETKEINSTDRGAGGFGSTGLK